MIKPFLAILLASVVTPVLAQTPAISPSAAPAPPPVRTDPFVAKLRDAALKDDLAYDIVEGLTTEVGQRLAATEAEARARTWAVARLRAMGFRNVRVETFQMPAWVRGEETAEHRAWVASVRLSRRGIGDCSFGGNTKPATSRTDNSGRRAYTKSPAFGAAGRSSTAC